MKKKEIQKLLKACKAKEVTWETYYKARDYTGVDDKNFSFDGALDEVIEKLERKLEKKKRKKRKKKGFITSKKEAKEFNKIMNQPPTINPKIEESLKLHDELIEEPNKAKEQYDKLNKDFEIIKSREDAEVFTETILNPPEPTEELKEAFNKYGDNKECKEVKESSNYDYKAIVEELENWHGDQRIEDTFSYYTTPLKEVIEKLKEKHTK